MPKFLAADVSAEAEPSRVLSVPGIRDTVMAIIGTSHMGPISTPIECNSWQDYIDNFGGDDANATLPNQVRSIYKQDKSAIVKVSRTVHFSSLTVPTKTSAQAAVNIASEGTAATAGSVTGTVAGFAVVGSDVAWRLAHNDTLVIHADADVGGPDTLTFTGTAASLTGGAAAGLPVSIGETIVFTVDGVSGSQTVTWSGNHATVELAAQDVNSQVVGFTAVVVGGATIDFTADTLGSDSAIAITSGTGTAIADIGHAVASDTGTGNVGNLFAITFTEMETLIEAVVVNPATGVAVTLASGNFLKITSGTTGAASSIEIVAASTADDELGFDNVLHSGSATSSVTTMIAKGKYDGTYAHDLRIVILAASNGDAVYFNLQVTDDEGTQKEIFPNLQVATDSDDDFVETVVNADFFNGGSKYILIEDQAVTIRPATVTFATSYTPAAGDDGLVGLIDTDFIGDSAGATGLHAFDTTQELNVLIDGARATAAYTNAMIAYAQSERETWCAVICDPPAGQTAAQMVSYVGTLTAAQQGALFWPRYNILNPNQVIYGNTELLTIAPSGAIAGIYSRTAAEALGGIHKAPAGIPGRGRLRGKIVGCQSLETDTVLDKAKRDVVYPKRINPLNFGSGTYHIDGSRGLDVNGDWSTIGEFRGVVFIVLSLLEAYEVAKHENNDEDLWALMRRTGRSFLRGQMGLGAFATKTEETAFFIECNEALNPPSVVAQEKVFFRLGMNKAKAASFVTILVSKDTRALEDELAG